MGLWWLSGVVVAQLGIVVAQWGCDGSVGLWWLGCLRQLGDTRLQSSSSGFDPGFPHSFLRGGRSNNCVS
jgi:hypothetical protein